VKLGELPIVLEIEIKAPCPDLEALEAKLKALGARDFGRLFQRDVYYSHPKRDFARTDEALRLRVENDLTLVTYKGPKLDKGSKTREELEVSLGNAQTFAKILERLGFRPVMTVTKLRKIYGIKGISVCLDQVEGLGDYVEFEFEGEDLEAGKARIMALMSELGVEGNERRSYLELIMQKKHKSKSKDRK
jgi:adenylate cyclase, class 2